MTMHDWTHRLVWWGVVNVALTFAAWGVWDLVLVARGDLRGNSASGIVLEGAQRHPAWAFAFGALVGALPWPVAALVGIAVGVLVGHFFWPQRRRT